MAKGKFELNAGTGIALGVIGGALLAVLVMALTGNSDVWVWAIPVGAAAGVAAGAGASRRG
jgi:uncharacterized transporter YbjL